MVRRVENRPRSARYIPQSSDRKRFMTGRDFTSVKGIGPATAAALRAAGFDSVAAAAEADLEELVAIPGVGRARATRVIAAANSEVDPQSEVPEPDDEESEQRRRELKAKRKDLRKRLEMAVKQRDKIKSKPKNKKKRRKLKATIADLNRKLTRTQRKLDEIG